MWQRRIFSELFYVSLILPLSFFIHNDFAYASKVNLQPDYLANAPPVTNNYSMSDNRESDSTSTSSSGAAVVIAKQFIQQLKQEGQQKQKETNNEGNNYLRHQTRQTFFDYFDVSRNIDLLDKKEDNRQKTNRLDSFDFDNNVEAKPEKEQREKTGLSKTKATDYLVLSPVPVVSSSRLIQNSMHGKDGTGNIDNDHGIGNANHEDGKRVITMVKSSPILPKLIINQPLHSRNRPAVSFEVNSSNVMYIFEVDDEEREKYFIDVVVEKMNCKIDAENETATPKLLIRGDEHELSICKNIDNSLNYYQAVDYFTSGDKLVSVMGSGNWTDTSAVLVASIYTESSHCHNCPNDHFCCGRKDKACANLVTGKSPDKTISLEHPKSTLQSQRYRCIPKQDADGTSLICDGHPNCGFHCNLDELSVSCPKEDNNDNNDSSGDNCPGYYCRTDQQDRFMITVLLLILFCVFVPFCIFLFFCSRKELRREFGRRGRCPLPLEIIFCPFSISADDPNPAGTSATASDSRQTRNGAHSRARGNGRRNFRRSEEVNSGRETSSGIGNPGFFDDLPPPYSECCNNKTLFPTPPEETRCGPVPDQTSNTRDRSATTSAFQLQPIMSIPTGIYRADMRPIMSTSTTSSTVTTSLSSPETESQADGRNITVATSNETSQ